MYPFVDKDPFIIDEEIIPDIYFAGNQPSFDSCVVKQNVGKYTRILCVPSFAETGTVVLVNLSRETNFECFSISF
jgi:DNA polymerase delta subunit 2